MLNINLIRVLITILAENGETRTLTLVKLINTYTNTIKVREPMVFEHIIKESTRNISLPFYKNIIVNWGDGEILQGNIHKYSSGSGKYRVKIYNESEKNLCTRGGIGWADNITDFVSIGRIHVNRLTFGYTEFNGRIHPNWDIANITDLSYMFCGNKTFNQKFGDNWDTGRVTDMSYMFSGASSFNQKIGDNWDTSRVTDMSYMFSGMYNFDQKIGDNWDTSNVTNMSYMFYGTNEFNQKIGDNWDTLKITDMSCMFANAIKFTQKIGDNWNISPNTNLKHMFSHTCIFTQEIGSDWVTSALNGIPTYFYNKCNVKYIPKWYVNK